MAKNAVMKTVDELQQTKTLDPNNVIKLVSKHSFSKHKQIIQTQN